MSAAEAQLPVFDWLATNFSDLSVFGLRAAFDNRPAVLTAGEPGDAATDWALSGVGLEASFVVGRFWKRKPPAGQQASKLDSGTRDTLQTKIRHDPDTTFTVTQAPARAATERLWAEIALGYSELGGFRSAVPGLDLRGTVRELPSLALYVSYLPQGVVSVYLGGRAGLAQLQGFRAYLGSDPEPDSSFTAGATTFQAGLALGGYVDVKAVTIFLEPSYTYRNFESVEWSNINGLVPDVLPRSLDFSTWAIAFGAQFPLGTKARGK